MTQPTPTTPSRLATALSGRKGGQAPPRADQAFDQEVDEELQREWFNKLWDQYSGYLLAGAVSIVLGVGAFKLMEHRRQVAAETAGANYGADIKQLTAGKTDEGGQALAAIAKTSGGFATLAKLRLAAADVAAGKTAEALAKYDALSLDRGIDPLLSGFARLQSAMLSLDTAALGNMQARLAELTSDNSPWRYNAQELLGMAAMKAGKTAEARAQFEKLASDQSAPAGIAERARIVMGSLVAAELAAKGPGALQQAPAVAPAKN